MAIVKAETIQGFGHLPALRQLGLMIALAGSVALGVAVVLWSQSPNYSLLYGNLDGKNAGQVLESLQKIGVQYKLDGKSGAILVSSKDVHKARIHLAKEGLPKGTGRGLEFLSEEESFKTSKFTQYRRYIHAQEIELARSISTIASVASARVHLAVPERSAFIGRTQSKPKATVIVRLYGGRNLAYGQVKAIVHMVASSIPGLSDTSVSVIDQNGRLLTRGGKGGNFAMSDSQFDYKNRIETQYMRKITELISPIVGEGRIRAKVEAELVLTRVDQTRESYNPDYPAVSSETIIKSKSKGGSGPGGVPGSLTNQPPKTGTTIAKNKGSALKSSTGRSSSRITRNYRNDKTISHIRTAAGKVKRLSIAVLIDDKRSVDEEGAVIKTPLTKKELEQFTALIKQATGFNVKRGDTIKVSNVTFYSPPVPKAIPPIPLLEQAWVWTVAKQAVGIFVVLILFFAVLKPVMRSLAEKGIEMDNIKASQQTLEIQATQQGADGDQQNALPNPEGSRYDEQLTIAKNMVGQDPGRVAQVVKNWVSTDGG
ncbi:Flagellar M-ring protein FliF [hydrothermal vent metagenome]|uniref:Flagellar M-ring protein FliF n=1 Tax=hydrothermal vent metagenome TaxID=652676 RepID=A0A3B0XWZ9_9ZZZZ